MAKGVKINPIIIQWAIRSSDRELNDLSNKFSKINDWISEESELTVNEINRLSKELKIPFGYFFLQEPPKEEVELLKYRTVENEENSKPSRDLIDTIKLMETRQTFMRETLIEDGFSPLSFVNSVSMAVPPTELAQQIKKELGLKEDWNFKNKDTFNTLRKAVSDARIIVMQNGIVGGSTRRNLDVNEFRAFILIDEFAPLIFLNAKDSYRAKIFSLCHELVHIWLGTNELYNDDYKQSQSFNNKKLEVYCNQVATEIVLPTNLVKSIYDKDEDVFYNIEKAVKASSVSSLVVCIRFKNLNLIDHQTFKKTYKILLEKVQENIEKNQTKRDSGGGDFYATANSRLDSKFISAVDRKAKEGRILYTEAYNLVGARGKVYDKLIRYVEDRRWKSIWLIAIV